MGGEIEGRSVRRGGVVDGGDQAVGCHQAFDRVEVHLQSIPLVEFDEQIRAVRSDGAERLVEFDEVVLEA